MTADQLTVGSLCTGYGGLDLALKAHFNTRVIWTSEIDKHASRVVKARYRAPNLGDLKLIDWATTPPPDIVTAGYPCQPFSSAGRRGGADDPRHIWPHIAEGVRALRPRLVVLENVAGHLTKGFGEVLGTLASMGYDATWGCVRASDAGAPHRRTRLFVVAVPDTTRPDGGDAQLAPLATPPPPPPEPRERGGPSPWGKWESAIRRWEGVMGRPAPRPVRHGMVSGPWVEWMMGLGEGWVTGAVDEPLDQLKILGNGVVPQQAALALTHLLPIALTPSRQRASA